MCGRYVMARATGDLAAELELTSQPEFDFGPHWNIAPTTAVPILLERTDQGQQLRELHLARWGLLPRWAKDLSFSARTFNARSETVTQKPAFRDAVTRRRAVVPVESYYEWRTETDGDGKARKRPFAVRPADGSLMLFAGLYEWWKDPAAGPDQNPWLLSTTILTTSAPQGTNGPLNALQQLHDRTPLALSWKDARAWMNPATLDRAVVETLLEEMQDRLPAVAADWEIYEVSAAVGNVRNNDAALAVPLTS